MEGAKNVWVASTTRNRHPPQATTKGTNPSLACAVRADLLSWTPLSTQGLTLCAPGASRQMALRKLLGLQNLAVPFRKKRCNTSFFENI